MAIDFSVCKFIKEQMSYYTYNDFCNNRFIIKKYFKNLDENGKLFYLWYVYANIHMKETFKNSIWDYLNDNINDEELLRMVKFYKAM